MWLAPALLAALSLAVPIPQRLAADVDDPYSLRVNPAGLGFLDRADLRLLLGRNEADQTAFGAFGAAPIGSLFTLGAALELDGRLGASTLNRTSLGIGTAIGDAALGVSWSDQGGNSIWTVGLGFRPLRWLSLAATGIDLGQAVGPRNYDLGLALHLFRERVLLSTRWRLVEDHAVDWDGGKASVDSRLMIEPVPGVYIGFGGDLQKRLSAQLALVYDRLSAGGAVNSQADVSGKAGWTAELAVRSEPLPSVFGPRPKVVVIELSGDVVPSTGFDFFDQRFVVHAYGAMPLLIEGLAWADGVRGAFLKIGGLSIGWARAEELRVAIERLKAAHKRVDCELHGAGDIEYFVASACDAIAMWPPGQLAVDGVAAEVISLGEALDRVGVKAEVSAMGAYKSAPEEFSRSAISEPHREVLTTILDQAYDALVRGIATARQKEPEAVKAMIDRGTLTSSEAKAEGWIDRIGYPDAREDWLAEQYGERVEASTPEEVAEASRIRWGTPRRIAIVPIDATITGGESTDLPLGLGRTVGATTLVRTLEEIRSDAATVAVVLRVESPGGDAVASDLIARAVQRVNEKKPVIASFGDVAASGGYYVSVNARAIYAEPNTLTGSIGVFSLGFSIEALLNKLGVGVDSFWRGAGAARHTILRDKTPGEMAMEKRTVAAIYTSFLEAVAKGRKMPVEEVRKVAEGRVWTGQDALSRRLVDAIGGLPEALRRARLEARLDPNEEVDLVVLPSARPSFPEAVQRLWAAPRSGNAGSELLGALLPHALKRWIALLADPSGLDPARPMALLPFTIELR
jgi:protease-4